jgi:hypothetical protein
MIFPIQGQLESLTAASNRRFTSWTASQVQRSIDDQNSEMKALVDAQSEDQKQRHDEFLKLYEELVDAMKPLQDFQKDASSILEAKEKADTLWDWYQLHYESAGGSLLKVYSPTGIVPEAFPAATGEIRWTLNEAPDGWLWCHGQDVSIQDYPELATVVQAAWLRVANPADDDPPTGFGTSEGDATFRLPTAEQCPGYIAGTPFIPIVRY